MIKGQISLDLMLAIIIAIVFVGSIALVAGVMADNAKIDSIRSQERQIGNEIAEVLNSATVLTGGDFFSVNYVVPRIRTANLAENARPVNCTIQILTDEIIITYIDLEGVETKTRVPFAIDSAGMNIAYKFQGTSSLQPVCGGEIVMSHA